MPWEDDGAGRNARSVWTIPTQPYRDAHFATFPEELARRCIVAGSSQAGRCPVCNAAWLRVVEREPAEVHAPASDYGHGAGRKDGGRSELRGASTETLGWAPSCQCGAVAVPDVVLDPFGGSGTVGQVATGNGRAAVLVDLNPEYLPMQRQRIGPLLCTDRTAS